MASVTFVLKTPKSKSESLILGYLRFSSKRIRFSTGEKVKPEFWDIKRSRARQVRSFPNYPELNHKLESIRSRILAVYQTHTKDTNNVDNNKLKEAVLEALGKGKDQTRHENLVQYISYIIEQLPTTINAKTGNPISPSTIKVYKQFKNILLDFEKIEAYKMTFEDVDMVFYNSFKTFMFEHKNYSINTTGKHIKTLKAVMNRALDDRLHDNRIFQSKKFKADSIEVDTVHVTEEEIESILALNILPKSKLCKIRDLFILGCRTGLRYSDLSELDKKYIIVRQGREFFEKELVKSKYKVVIPIHKDVKLIMKKYQHLPTSFPKPISNPNMNKYVKELCENIESLHERVEIKKTAGGKIVKENIEKYKLISTHTCRRSFATNEYLNRMDSIDIMQVTGHKTEKDFLKYIRITPDAAAMRLSKAWEKRK